MIDEDIVFRIRRIHAAVEAVEKSDMSSFPARIIRGEKVTGVFQDFRGSLTDEELVNLANNVIHNIANMADHLKKWAKINEKDPKQIDEMIKRSRPIKLIIDLSNNDKHGYPPRDGGASGVSPVLGVVRTFLRMTTAPVKGAVIAMTLGPSGEPKISGSGTAKVVVTADILDDKGAKIDELHKIMTGAVEDWENLSEEIGIPLNLQVHDA